MRSWANASGEASTQVNASHTCGGYPCFFFAAVDSEEARSVYRPEPSTMQKRCKITRCVYQIAISINYVSSTR